MKIITSTLLIGSAAILTLSACGSKVETEAEKTTETVMEIVAEIAPLDAVLAGEWRGEQKARDVFRNPKETLEFFGLEPGQTVLEIFPGGGWYTNILAPYAAKTGGTYIAAGFDPALGERYAASNQRFLDKFSDAEIYGDVEQRFLGPDSPPLGAGDVDLVLSFRNVHSWMRTNYADKAFAEFYAALKPGGILGIVEHRLPESMEQDPKAGSGYVQVSYTKALAKEAGFEFVEASEINANAKDSADHPYGVWTLPPSSRTPKEDEEGAADFDAAKYLAIGESDRYTLKFRKPVQ
ncbi:MAG: methyltransferase domain-containing protein [Acidimicrobiales bacterium]|nr:class I SAM-dependent methyltransferase [Hyphomonadaceae bacterium]RZV44859.1 MAG: methyltransferase domain-containing protein [Acidimicrobiales bacterium]